MKIKVLLGAVLLSSMAVAYAGDGAYLNVANNDDVSTIHKGDNTLGLGAAYVQSAYKGVDNYARVFPMVNFTYGNFYWKMFNLGYNFYQNDDLAVALVIAPNFTSYDSGDSDDLSGMDSRELSVFTGGQISYRLKPVNLSLFAGQDVTGRTDGQEAIAKVAMPFPIRDGQIVLVPAISATWLSSDVVDYYYGVKSSEATDDRAEYNPDSTVNTAFTLTTMIQLNQSWRVTLAYNYTHYGDEISDSPIVDKDNASSGILGVSYVFS